MVGVRQRAELYYRRAGMEARISNGAKLHGREHYLGRGKWNSWERFGYSVLKD